MSTAAMYGFVKASRQRMLVVSCLREGPKTPTEISAETGLHIANVSRTLSQLVDGGIAYCLSPELRKGRLYGLRAETSIGLSLSGREGDMPARGPQQAMRAEFLPRVRGEALLAGVAAAAELVGADGLIRIAKGLGVNLLRIGMEGWYPMDIHHSFLRRLASIPQSAGLESCREVGRRSIGYLVYLNRFLRRRRLDIPSMGERIPLIHGHYFNFGRFEVKLLGTAVEIRQFDMMPTEEFCAARRGNYEGALAAAGYDAEVQETTCENWGDAHCTFRVMVVGPRRAAM